MLDKIININSVLIWEYVENFLRAIYMKKQTTKIQKQEKFYLKKLTKSKRNYLLKKQKTKF